MAAPRSSPKRYAAGGLERLAAQHPSVLAVAGLTTADPPAAPALARPHRPSLGLRFRLLLAALLSPRWQVREDGSNTSEEARA